jgi:hypothetical protein
MIVMPNNKVFLPLVQYSKPKSYFVGTDKYMPSYVDSQKLAFLGIYYLTIGNFLWSKLEPSKGKYDNNILDAYAVIINNVIMNKMMPFACIHSTPQWAISTDYATDKIDEFFSLFQLLTDKLSTVKHWQIFNEVDSRGGLSEHFGGWGDEHILEYTNLLKFIQSFRPNVKLSVSLMMPGNSTWYIKFAEMGGNDLIDYVNFHFYPYWWSGYDDKDLQKDLDKLEVLINNLKKVFHKPLRLTETNLLFKGASNPEYESMKTNWIYASSQLAQYMGLDAYLIYGYKSGWNNANMAGLPAEDAFKNICKKYNGI